MPDKQNLEPLLGTQQNQLGLVMADGTAIDSKALAVLAANIAVLIFIAQSDLGWHGWSYALLLSPFIVSLAFDIVAILPRTYLGAAADLNKHPEYLNMKDEALVLQLLADTKKAIEHNRAINALRWRFCLVSIVVTLVGTAALFAIL